MGKHKKSALEVALDQRDLPTRAEPEDSLRLLFNRDLLEWAANPWENPHWQHARSTTTGVDQLTLADAFPDRAAISKWANKAESLLRLPLHLMKRAAPALKISEQPKKEPWDPDYDPQEKRVTYVPCVLRRVISSHLADILAITSRRHVSDAAKAYVAGQRNPAPEVSHDVARKVASGGNYWGKFDIKDCFNSVAWKPLRKALLKMGYPEQFVSILMIFVSAPAAKWRRNRWVRVHRHRGTAAGLPESGILLNILMAEIDEQLSRIPGLLYRRYSDDIIMNATHRGTVEEASRVFCGWAWRKGFRMKGLQKRADAARLVKDIRDEPLQLLGVLIDAEGNRHIPQGKVDAHLNQRPRARTNAHKIRSVNFVPVARGGNSAWNT